MSCRTETTSIGEHEYSVTQWPAEKAMVTKLKLIKAFGAPLAVIAGAIKKDSTDEEQAKAIGEGLQLIFEANNPEEIAHLIKSSVIGTARDGKKNH